MTRSRLPLLLAAGVLAPLVALGPSGAVPGSFAAEPPEPPAASPTPGPPGTPTTTAPSSPTPEATTPSPSASEPSSSGDPTATPAEPGTDPATPEQQPLEVRLESIRPAVVPRRAPLRLTGTVTNRSESTWTELQAYVAVSADPITTPEELAAAQAEPAGLETSFGRLVEEGLFADLPDLAPGESAGFRIVVPRDRLGIPETPGVYRIGVHALGSEEGVGRVEGADGRARTFLPQLPATLPRSVQPTRLALVMQLRNHTVRSPSGDLDFIRGWRRTLAGDGRLGRLLALSGTTSGFPLTWVLDPAVVEAAGTVSEGNPSTDLGGRAFDGVDDVAGGGTRGDATTGEDSPSPDESDAGSDSEAGSESPDADVPTVAASQGVADAEAWLDELRLQAPRHPVLAVPYGDLDVAAAARAEDTETIGRSVRLGIETLSRYDVTASPVAAPLNGALKGWMIDRLPADVPVVLSDDALPGLEGTTYRRGDRPLLRFSPETLRPDADAAAAAGVDETDSTALGLRQRLLAVTAVRTLTGDERPLVAMLPPSWDPGPGWQRSAFFEGLDVPWISATGLGDVAAEVTDLTPQPEDDAFAYLPAQREAEVPGLVVDRVAETTQTAELLDDTLVDDDVTGPRLTRQALLAASFYSRRRPAPAETRLDGIEGLVESWLREIRIAAPPFVISSSEEGSFLVPVVNGLDQRVRVALRAEVSGPGLEVLAPDAVELPPGTRRPLQLQLRSTAIGVHNVDLDLVTEDGERLYAGPSVPVRTSRVGFVVWVVMGVAATVFFTAIAVRIVRRVRRRRRTHGPVLRSEA